MVFSHFISHKPFTDCRDTKLVLTLELKKDGGSLTNQRWKRQFPVLLLRSQAEFTLRAASDGAGWEFSLGMISLQICSFVLQAVREIKTEAPAAPPHTPGTVSELAWATLPSSLLHQSTTSPGFGDGRQLPACRQGEGTRKDPSARGKPGLTAQLPARRFGCRPALPALQ